MIWKRLCTYFVKLKWNTFKLEKSIHDAFKSIPDKAVFGFISSLVISERIEVGFQLIVEGMYVNKWLIQ